MGVLGRIGGAGWPHQNTLIIASQIKFVEASLAHCEGVNELQGERNVQLDQHRTKLGGFGIQEIPSPKGRGLGEGYDKVPSPPACWVRS